MVTRETNDMFPFLVVGVASAARVGSTLQHTGPTDPL